MFLYFTWSGLKRFLIFLKLYNKNYSAIRLHANSKNNPHNSLTVTQLNKKDTWGGVRRNINLFNYFALKTDGSLCVERKCLLTRLARDRWLWSNDNVPIGEGCKQQCRLPSSDVLWNRTEGSQKALTIPLCSSATGLWLGASSGLVGADICNCINIKKGADFHSF